MQAQKQVESFLYRICVLRTFQNPVHFIIVLYQRLFGGGRLCPPLPFIFCHVDFILDPYFTNPLQDGAHVQKITNGGYSLYVPVQSGHIPNLSHLKGVQLELQLNPIQMAPVMDTAALKTLCTGTYKLHPPLIVIMI